MPAVNNPGLTPPPILGGLPAVAPVGQDLDVGGVEAQVPPLLDADDVVNVHRHPTYPAVFADCAPLLDNCRPEVAPLLGLIEPMPYRPFSVVLFVLGLLVVRTPSEAWRHEGRTSRLHAGLVWSVRHEFTVIHLSSPFFRNIPNRPMSKKNPAQEAGSRRKYGPGRVSLLGGS